MRGNATYRFQHTSVLSVSAVDAPVVVTSEDFDARLAETYKRVGLRSGLLASLAGIQQRRWWPNDMSFTDGAAIAAEKALAEAGVDRTRIGLMVNTSVSRDHLEPSIAVSIHHALDLPTTCLNFDLANACLGFVNGMQVAAAMIDNGQIDYALVVNGETTRQTQEVTLARLASPEATLAEVMAQFATLTLGSGAAAMVLGRTELHPNGHRLVGGVARAGTEHHQLCVGDFQQMRTDTANLLKAGIELSGQMWDEAKDEFAWADMSRYIAHQVSQVHTDAMCARMQIDPTRVPRSFPMRGNMGPASVPFTLALESDSLQAGDRVLLMGIGSGLNTSCTEIVW